MSKVAGKIVIKAYEDGTADIKIDAKNDLEKCSTSMITTMCDLLEDDENNLVKQWMEAAILVRDIRKENKGKKKKKSK